MGASWAATCWAVFVLPEERSIMRAALSAPAPTTLVPSCIKALERQQGQIRLSIHTFDQQQPKTGCSCSKSAFPSLPPEALISYILTFLSHDATARCSDWGENLRSEIPSSGGAVRVTSLEISPMVFVLAAAEGCPKRPDMVVGRVLEGVGE